MFSNKNSYCKAFIREAMFQEFIVLCYGVGNFTRDVRSSRKGHDSNFYNTLIGRDVS